MGRRGPSGLILVVGLIGFTGYNMIQWFANFWTRYEMRREKMQRRMYLMPLLLAEHEISFRQSMQRQDELMKYAKALGVQTSQIQLNRSEPYVPQEIFLQDLQVKKERSKNAQAF